MNKKIVIVVWMVVVAVSCLAGKGVKEIPDQTGGITLKTIKNPDYTITSVFFSKGKEIAQQVRDRKEHITKTTGTIPDGPVKEFYESGSLKEVAYYKNNKREGTSKWYYENGILQGERTFKDDILEGIIKWYYTTGSLGTEFNYKNGLLEGLTKLYWENGNIKAEHNYLNGKREGINKQYYENGELRFIYTFKNGKSIKREEYSKNGKFLKEHTF